jgi:excisionase family DNA binding protein
MKHINNNTQSNAPAMVVYYGMTDPQIEAIVSRAVAKVLESTKVSPAVITNDPAGISRADTAKVLGVSVQTVNSLLRRGALKFQKIGARVVIDRADLMMKFKSGEVGKYKRMK